MPLLTQTLALALHPLVYLAAAAVLAVTALALLSIARTRAWLLKNLAYAYLLRFPLLTAAALVGLVLVSKWFARSLLGNLFDIHWPIGILLVSFTAFMTAWTVMLTWRLVVRHGVERFNLNSFVTEPYQTSPSIGPWQIAKFGFLALPIVCYAVSYTITWNPQHVNSVRVVGEAVLGFLSALLLLWIIGRLLRGREGLARRVAGWFGNVKNDIGRGYFEYDEHGTVVTLLPGHGIAATMLLVSLMIYIAVGVLKWYWLGDTPVFPTLGYVLLLLMLLCWGLSGLAFFLDRFRVPVLLPLLVLFFLTSLPPWSDTFYPVLPGASAQYVEAQCVPPPAAQPTPGAALASATPPTPGASPTPAAGGSIIVVAANGGGIQAAAWAARVLTGLQEAFGDSFGGSVRVVSSVSGGSVGAMYFVNEYEGGRLPSDAAELNKIVERAEGSSLDEVAWGLAYPDLFKLFTSYGFGWDRGNALEWAWRRHDLGKDGWGRRDNISVGLSQWKKDVAEGKRPGSIFNTTISDTGQRLPLSTVDMPPDTAGCRTQGQFFNTISRQEGERKIGRDLSIVTAARLSAAFPYVSPAARADVEGTAVHVVDGGYYDNYGISSLIEWLNAELEKNATSGNNNIGRVLVVEIHGAPTGERAIDVSDAQDKDSVFKLESNRGWFYQTYAPLGTLLHVRETGQLSHNNIELKLLIEKWVDRGVPITHVVFEFDGTAPPLSWHLNQVQKKDIEVNWCKEYKGAKVKPPKALFAKPDVSNLAVVGGFLGLGDPPTPDRCPPESAGAQAAAR